MNEATITVRGKTTTFKYQALNRLGLIYANVVWESGEETHFYKGMYGKEDRWENRYMPDDLVLAVSEVLNKAEVLPEHAVDYWAKPPVTKK